MSFQIRPIAIHLPQFHPTPENDEWWGKGFTEWTNVTKAKPWFEAHYQPHLPSDLGFYDLRLEEARIAQAELAREYGIYGFCYYHYWFNGRRILNRPLDDILRSKKPDFPFMLCWANENWTRRWDGMDSEVLLKQEYNSEDDRNHMRFLCNNFFSDPRYIKKDGKPFFVIYRPGLFPNIKASIETWREEAVKAGIGDIYLGFMNHFHYDGNFEKDGFDCEIEFHPNFKNLPASEPVPFLDNLKMKFGLSSSLYRDNMIYDYPKYIEYVTKQLTPSKSYFPGVTPSWDNSPRRNKKGAFIFKNASPHEYEKWLEKIKEAYKNIDSFVFINAWNEWAEGNHLEPCMKWGRQYLEVTKKVFKNG